MGRDAGSEREEIGTSLFIFLDFVRIRNIIFETPRGVFKMFRTIRSKATI